MPLGLYTVEDGEQHHVIAETMDGVLEIMADFMATTVTSYLDYYDVSVTLMDPREIFLVSYEDEMDLPECPWGSGWGLRLQVEDRFYSLEMPVYEWLEVYDTPQLVSTSLV